MTRTRTRSHTYTKTYTVYHETIKKYNIVGYEIRVWREISEDYFDAALNEAFYHPDGDVTAIINHERSSWGNHATPVSPDEVKKIMDFILLTEKQ